MNALVTGGGGFLGGAVVRLLVSRGDRVASFSRYRYPELAIRGVTQHQGDLRHADAVEQAVAGSDVVFHVASNAGVGGRYANFHRTNVDGTANVIAACRKHGVRRLVYTSSPSVVFDGRDMEGVNESVPYPEHYEAHYPKTKALAERLVLAANGPDLATVALRPHLIWGPGDNHLIPRLLERARKGRLFRIGKDNKRIDSVYIDNAAEAHLLAGDRLGPGAACAGKAYFITNGEPLGVWDLIERILATAGLSLHPGAHSVGTAVFLGWLCELLWKLLPLRGEPPLTRWIVRELTTAHWFDLTAARRDLGYEPRVSLAEGLRRLEEQFQRELAVASARRP
jgi:nucleoside-diphosphate-sugar epimerase